MTPTAGAACGAPSIEARRFGRAGSFAGRLTSADLSALRMLGRQVRFRAGDRLMSVGEAPDSVLLLTDGLVKVVIGDGDGTDHVLAVRGPGELLGEMSCLEMRPRSATVVALCPVRAFKVPGSAFGELLLSRPQMGRQVARLLSSRLHAANRQRAEVSSYAVCLRLLKAIGELALVFSDESGSPGLEIPLSQDELGQLIGAAQVSVQRALRELRAQRVLSTGYRKVTVPCLPCLERVVDAATTTGRKDPANAITGCGGRSHHHSR
ncbi:MAG TPA: Crp/Fnr family transcriptional regulator [Pseudonocardiaceae bacterium]|nr:Crp/Fnr family transcriptional regulator [Pseudonocardiaceae bacterium]